MRVRVRIMSDDSLPLSVYCLSVDPLGGEQDRGVLASDQAGLLYSYDGGRAGCAREAGRGSKRAEAGGLGCHKERSHRVVVPAVRVNDWWRSVAGSFYGREPEYQGPHVASRERGRRTETGARGDAIIIDAAVYVGVRGDPQAVGGQDAAGGQDWVVRRGGSRRHTRPTDSLDTHRGRRYMQIPVRPGPKQTKGPLPACPPACPPALLRGSGQGQFSGPLKARGRRRVGTCLAPSCIVEVPSGGSDGDLSCPSCLARPNSAVPVRCYCHGRNAMLLGKFCHTRDEPGQAESASACSRYAAASLFHTAVEAQLAGWAAKSIQPSMIHQIGVGICPERLDPAVAGLATRGRHSRVEALRLETCCANHEPSTPVHVKVLPCTSRLPVGLSWTAGTIWKPSMSRPCAVTSPPDCQTARTARASAQLSGRQSDHGIAVPEVALASRSGSRRLRPTVSLAASAASTRYLEVHPPAVLPRPSHSHIAH